MTFERYSRREFLGVAALAGAALTVPGCVGARIARRTGRRSKPNFILILTDDQGYNDLGCFGSKLINTPNIDRMAAEGVKLTSFYTGAPICGPSRAALLTGCYSQRVDEVGRAKHFHTILHGREITIAEVLKKAGYVTKAIGKWHVAGSGRLAVVRDEASGGYRVLNPSLMPPAQGFDSYFGIPYSNDMDPSVLMRDYDVVEAPVNQVGLTTRYTDEALRFIRANKDRPFFLYLAHNMPHTPLYPSKKFEGKSAYGLYGDCVEEIDWNVGRILQALKELEIDEDTFVVYTSDNGPWIEGPERRPDNRTSRLQSGTAKPLRGYKMTTWDGGVRVPCIVRFPGKVPAGRVIDEIATAMDFMPTFARLAGTHEPQDRIIDGKDIMPLLTGKQATSPHEAYYFYKYTHLHGVRSGHWKLVLPRPARPKDLEWYARLQEEVKEITLYNLRDDIGERRNVADQHPEVVARLMKLVEKARADLGDRFHRGKGSRFSR
ncbi:MAG TPA: N-acetylgalactosamine-6-sulfatase [Phycisphaerales bacterium]|nr:N-acetylgalactosamine-6-sulfatase [Phycisphaerales bacterium]